MTSIGLVHGLGTGPAVWDRLLGLLPPTVNAWVFSLPWDAADGYGWALDGEPRRWLAEALRLVPEPPEVIVAHSFGANVVLDYLCAGGDATGLAGLVLVSPFYRATPEGLDWAALTHYVNDFPEVLKAGILARQSTPAPPDLVRAMAEKVRDRIGAYGWLSFFRLFSATPALGLGAVQVPCLVVGGGTDTASYPEDCTRLAAGLPRGSAVILQRCGHFTMLDDPPAVAELLVKFLHDIGSS
jgi:pimeloyl-ACP methyl ester carboxylesterase